MPDKTLTFSFRLLDLAEMYSGTVPDISKLGPTDPKWLAIVDGDLEIRAGDETFLEESHFPLADLVRQLDRWTARSLPEGAPFVFDGSLHFEEQGALTFEREGTGWRLRSIWERIPGGAYVEAGELERMVKRFVGEAGTAVRSKWGAEVRRPTPADIARLLALFAPYCSDRETWDELADVARHSEKWGTAHRLFQRIRQKTLSAEQARRNVALNQFLFEEVCAKTLYNRSGEPASFDDDSADWILPNALAFGRQLGLREEAVLACFSSEEW